MNNTSYLRKSGTSGRLVPFSRRSIAVILSVLLIAGVMPVAQANDTEKIELDVYTLVNGEPIQKFEYFSGEPITPLAQLNASGTGVDYSNVSFKITVDKSPFITKPLFTDANMAVCAESETDTQWIQDCKIANLKGGTRIGLPYPFTFKNLITPDGSTVNTNVSVVSADGRLNLSKNYTFTARSSSAYKPAMNHYGEHRNKTIGTQSNVGEYDFGFAWDAPQEPTTTPSTGVSTYHWVRMSPDRLPGATGNIGEYQAKRMKFIVPIPTEAEFVPSGDWKYDAATHTATWEGAVNSTVCWNSYNPYCKTFQLKWKNTPLKDANGGQAWYPLVSDIIVDPGTPQEQVLPRVTDQVTFSAYRIPKPVFTKTHRLDVEKFKIGKNQSNKEVYRVKDGNIDSVPATDREFVWSLTTKNSNNGSDFDQNPRVNGIYSVIKTIRDNNLDSRLYYERFEMNPEWAFLVEPVSSKTKEQVIADFDASTNSLVGIKADGTEVVLADHVKSTSSVEIKDTAREYVKLELRLGTPQVLDNFGFAPRVTTKLTAADVARWVNNEYSTQQTYENWPQVDGINPSNGNTWTVNEQGVRNGENNYFAIAPMEGRLRMLGGENLQISYVNCESRLPAGTELTPQNCSRLREQQVSSVPEEIWRWQDYSGDVKNLRHIVVLPAGISYVRTTQTVINNTRQNEIIEPVVVQNFRNTGKTALVYNYGDVPFISRNHVATRSHFVLDTTIYSKTGKNEIEMYTVWDNNDFVRSLYETYDDVLDLDADGNTTERFLKRTFTHSFIPPNELLGRTEISTDAKNWVFNAPAQDLGGDIYYKLNAQNSGAFPLNEFSLIQVLPDTGRDHKIVPNEAGQYLPRTWQMPNEDGTSTTVQYSAYKTPLVGPMEDLPENKTHLQRFKFRYSVTPQGADLASVRDAQWLTADQITDWSAVKAVRVDLNEGFKVNSGESIAFVTKNKIPWDNTTIPLRNYSGAVSSEALSPDTTGFLEANEVTSRLIQYYVKGIVWNDMEKDGNHDATKERLLDGYEVRLFNADGTPALNPDGSEVKPVFTDSKGAYQIPVYPRGEYKVGFKLKSSNSPFTILGGGEKPVASHVQNFKEAKNKGDWGYTDVFTLNPDNLFEIRNAGIIAFDKPIDIAKTDQFGKPLEGVEFTLTWKNALPNTVAPDPLPEPKTGKTNAEGKLTFENVTYGVYTLTEKVSPNFVAVAPREITVNNDPFVAGEKNASALPIQNTRIVGTVNVKKIDLEAPSKTLAGAIFTLTSKDGKTVFTSQPTAEDGTTTFTEVPYGEYNLVETVAPAHYVKSDKVTPVSIQTHEQVITVDPYTNRIFKGTVIAEKHDLDTKELLPGATFGLFPVVDGNTANVAAYTAVTDANGKLQFDQVNYGQYKLREIEAPVGYLLGSEEYDVAIETDGQVFDFGSAEDQRIPNKIKEGNVLFTKVDDENAELILEGVKFGLYAKDNGAVSADAEPAYTAVSGTDGKVLFTNVRYGDYELREMETLINYVLSEEVRDVLIRENGVTIALDNFTNTAIRGSISLYKADAETKSPVEGAEFGLFPIEDTSQSGDTPQSAEGSQSGDMPQSSNQNATQNSGEGENNADVTSKAPAYTAVTDKDGKLTFTRIPYGKYELREIKAPVGYLLSDEVREVFIETHEQHIDLSDTTWINEAIRSDVTFTKVDSVSKKALAGAEFALYRVVNDKVEENATYVATANEQGNVLFEGVRFGKYELRETKAPTGYQLSKETRVVDVVNNAETLTLGDFTNVKIPAPVKLGLAKTGSTLNSGIMLSVAILAMGGAALYARRRLEEQES